MVHPNTEMNTLMQMRLEYQPNLPQLLRSLRTIALVEEDKFTVPTEVRQVLPETASQPSHIFFSQANQEGESRPLRIGVVFSGGPAPGGHNVISGIFDAIQKIDKKSQLFGFKNGPKGILENKFVEITEQLLAGYRNQGGFDLIGSGRSKIETIEQFSAAEKAVRGLQLDGLVVIGGDDSNTNAAFLAEYFLLQKCTTAVIGVPKTIDGDLRNEDLEISFGFDTATKTYAETIGNIMREALSSKKYFHFIKLMGRYASHITLECALKTCPNLALISEEIAQNKQTLQQVTDQICDLVIARSKVGKNYGVILIPEGIIESIAEFKHLISDLNHLLAPREKHANMLEKLGNIQEKVDYLLKYLSAESAACLPTIPQDIQAQLLLDRDPHGNVQVSKIDTEHLFIELVEAELAKRRAGSAFSAVPHFCGYEGRAAFPSNFDAQYCYALGMAAVVLVYQRKTGYICCVHGLNKPIEQWQAGARSFPTMMCIEKRHGKDTVVIGKSLVDLNSTTFQRFKAEREKWAREDCYQYPGPIQFFGPSSLTDSRPLILCS